MYLIGYFSKQKKFHVVAQRATMDEVEAYLRNHNHQKLVVFGRVSIQTQHAPDVVESADENDLITKYLQQ